MKKFSLFWYLVLVCALSWPFQIASSFFGTGLFSRYAFNATSMIMVAVATFIYGRYVCGDGFKRAGWNWGKPVHYLLVILLAAVIWIFPTIVDFFKGAVVLPATLETWQIVAIFVFIFVTIIPGFGEEFGWRGYMLPHIAERFTPRKAVLLQAIIWWLWHMPILTENFYYISVSANAGNVATITIVYTILFYTFLSALPAIGHGIVFAYIWTRTGSLAVAVLYHALIDGFRDSIQVTIGHGPFAGLWINIAFIVLGIVMLTVGDWSRLKTFRKA